MYLPSMKYTFWEGDITHFSSSQIGFSQLIKVHIQSKFTMLNQWVLLELLIGIWMKGHLLEQTCLKDSSITKAHPSMSYHSEVMHTTQPVGSSNGYSVSFSGTSPGINRFQVIPLVFNSLLVLGGSLPPFTLVNLSLLVPWLVWMWERNFEKCSLFTLEKEKCVEFNFRKFLN